MRMFPYYLVFVLLFTSACNDLGTPSCVGPNGSCGIEGLVPDYNRFNDPATNSNKNVTNMFALNDAQVTAYVQHKLNGYIGDGSTDYLAIAEAALDIAGGASLSGISDGVLEPAMYIVSPELYATCGNSTDISSCVSGWNVENAALVALRLKELRARAELLDIEKVDFATTAGATDNLNFSIDASGKIIGVTVGGVDYVRNGNTNTFSNADATLTYNSWVLNEDSGISNLSYSDFGVYQVTSDGVAGNNIPFAGGYASQKIAENDVQTAINSDITFAGAAVGTVTNADDGVLNIVDNRASLVFSKDTGASTLTANFSDWYNISVTKALNETDASITFSGYNGTSEFQLPSGVTSGTANVNMGYYGPNPTSGIPIETTGLIEFADPSGINMGVAFGGVIK